MVRSISTDWCAGNSVGFYVELDRNVLRCSVTVAEMGMLRGYILFEVGANGQWEKRAADWIANYWCVMLEELEPVGVSCSRKPALRRLVEGEDGRGSVSLDPVRLESFTRVITAAGLSVFPGQEVHVVMNFLLSKLRDCLADPVLIDCLDCPALVRVSVNWFSFCFLKELLVFDSRDREVGCCWGETH